MRKFDRLNEKTKLRETFISCGGYLKTIDTEARVNKISGREYYRFTANLETPNTTIPIGGQVYKSQIQELGRMPEVGDGVDFNCRLKDLEEIRENTRWGIGRIHKLKIYHSESNYEDGSVRSVGNSKNGFKDGVWKTYYNTGELNLRVKYLMDVKDGVEEVWLPSGQLISKVNFKNGLKCGSFEYYYPNGQLKEKGTFSKNSKRDGVYEKYLENGGLEDKLLYKDGNVVEDINMSVDRDSKVYISHSMDSNIIYSLSFDELVEHTYSSFAREFGERKLKKVMNKVLTSRKVERFIRESKLRKIPPHNNYIIQMLNEIPFFIFSRGQTVVVGAMVALQKWNEQANKTTYMLSEGELKQRAVYIITESKSMFF